MKNIKIKTVTVLCSIFFFCVSAATYAQIGLPGDGDPSGPSDVPVDGLLAFGLIAGAAIGIRKFFKKEE